MSCVSPPMSARDRWVLVHSAGPELGPALVRGRGVERPTVGALAQHDPVGALGRRCGDVALANVDQDGLGVALEGIPEAAAAGSFEADHIAALQGIVRVPGGQALLRVRPGVDPDVAGPPRVTARQAGGGDQMFGRADREPRVREIEILAANSQTTPEPTGSAGIADQLEAEHPGGKLALDDLDGCDFRVALVDRRPGGAVRTGPRSRAPADDLILDVSLTGVGAASAND